MGCGSSRDEWEDDYAVGTERVTIVIDRGHDENEIPEAERGYRDVEPPLREESNPLVNWYDKEEGEEDVDEDKPVQNGGRSSRRQSASTARDLKDLQLRLTGTGTTTQLQQKLMEAEDHALKATKGHTESFDKLIAYLTENTKTDQFSDLLTVRSLIMWLANQKVEQGSFGKATDTTPRGYLQLIREGRATYASFFTVLSRLAGIDCLLIHGICRAGSYQPGDTDTDIPECLWAAVNINGQWQIIHPFWTSRAMIGHTFGGWLRLESGGKADSGVDRRQKGTLSKAFKEYFFMPKPEEFIYMCYPDDVKMQLLPRDKVIKNKYHFLRLPYLFPPFFGLGLKLITEHSCELNSHNGKLKIEFLGNPSNAYKLCLSYDMYRKSPTATDDEMVQDGNLPRLVFNTRTEEKFSFDIRFPIEGEYKLVIYGGPYGKPGLRLCEFKLNCEQRLIGCQLLPVNTGLAGWGPGPKTERAGLLVPSKMGGVIPMDSLTSKVDESEKIVHAKFNIDNDKMKAMQYSAHLIGGANNTQDLSKYVTCKVDHLRNELNVTASVPTEGEYGLVIKAGRKGGGRMFSVCNYLLTTETGIREGVPKRKARRALREAMMRDDALEELANVIDKCKKVKIEQTDDDVKAASNRLAFLKMKHGLKECHRRRNLDVTNKTLKEVTKYKHKLALIVEIRRVQRLRDQLEKLGGFSLEVPQLKDACEELTHVPRVGPEVLSTIKALFLLLGEHEDDLYDWPIMQIMMKPIREQGKNVLTRMRNITERTLDVQERKRIDSMLHKYNEEQVRHSSQAAASFYRWIHGVLAIYSGEPIETDTLKQDPARQD